ncbi:hypothetical protein B0H19DRAFT_1145147 [Mycena capillaripes]|nr:hypothetical protein B0H19DRAFT_1145147 [Mycena capillaripes]
MPTLPVVTFVLGGWDLGICGDLLLQGVIFTQFAHYVALYKQDILLLRAFVAGLLVITTLKTVQQLALLWMQNVLYFMDLDSALGAFQTAWFLQINVSFVALIVFYVQAFFVQRLWVLSRNIYLVVCVTGLFVFALLAAFVSSAFTIANDNRDGQWVAVHLGTVFAGDLVLCGGTAFFLLKHSKRALPATAGMLNAILRLMFQSAAPGAVCALANLVGSQAGVNGTLAWTMVAIMTNNWLPKLYALSAMWTLNSRKDIRVARSGAQTGSSTEGRVVGRRRTENVELGMISGPGRGPVIHVRTEVSTVPHTEDLDVFSPKNRHDKSEESSKN